MENKCTPIEGNLPAFKIPKKEWDWLLKEGWLTKEQYKFLKKAESLGYEVEVRPIGTWSFAFKSPTFAESEAVITKRLNNKV